MSAIVAGFIATVVMTIWMAFFGMNIMKLLGLTAGMEGGSVYLVGGLIHLIIGLFWGLVYALIFEPLLQKLPGFLSGALFSLIPFVLAMIFMGTFISTIKNVFKADVKHENPSAVSRRQASQAGQQLNPDGNGACPNKDCVEKKCPSKTCPGRCPMCPKMAPEDANGNGASDSGLKKTAYSDWGDSANDAKCAAKPYSEKPNQDDYPCYPCKEDYKDALCKPNSSPCGYMCSPHTQNGGIHSSSLPIWLWSLINHLVFGVVLGFIYKPHKKENPTS